MQRILPVDDPLLKELAVRAEVHGLREQDVVVQLLQHLVLHPQHTRARVFVGDHRHIHLTHPNSQKGIITSAKQMHQDNFGNVSHHISLHLNVSI